MKKKELPKISVVLPVLNRAHMIERAIKSVINQNYPKVELIIMDGGSTDGTVEVIKQYSEYITYWQNEPDDCCTTAINAGINKATGDLIVILMSDDWLEKRIFFRVAESYLANDVDIIVCGGRRVAQYDNQFVEQVRFSGVRQSFSFLNTCLNPFFAICCCFIKPEIYRIIGLFLPYNDNGLFIANDREWVMRASLHSVTSLVLSDLGYTHCAHGGSTTFGNNRKTIIRIKHEHEWIASHFKQKCKLSVNQRLILLLWVQMELSYLFYLSLMEGDYKDSLHAMNRGMKNHFLMWPLVFSFVTVRALLRKCCRFIKQKTVGFKHIQPNF